jgi:hypothetical protein
VLLPTNIEIRLHGKWILLADMPYHSCLDDVTNVSETAKGYLIIGTGDNPLTITKFKPLSWRVKRDKQEVEH